MVAVALQPFPGEDAMEKLPLRRLMRSWTPSMPKCPSDAPGAEEVVANSGGDVKDMADSVDWIGKGILHPEVMITHVGGLDSAFQATLDLPKVPGGKRLVYTHVNMPMTAIADFAEKGKDDPFYAELDRLCAANNGLWCKEAEDYLLANAPKVEIGAPKEKIVERRIEL